MPEPFLERLRACPEYAYIAAEYHGKVARRSGLSYLNHIHEGAFILQLLYGWQDTVIGAYCLHPIFQSDRRLQRLAEDADSPLQNLPPEIVLLGMEYRRVANAYTLTDPVRAPDRIELSPLPAVNHMLVADKIQNRKDFMAHIYYQQDRATFREASDRSRAYFDSWLARLEVSEEMYESVLYQVTGAFP